MAFPRQCRWSVREQAGKPVYLFRDGDREYQHHVTLGRFPYVIGGYRGVPEASNNRGLRHAGTGAVDIPADASVGMLLDCHIEFPPAFTGRPVVVFKRNDVMRVAE